MGEVCDRETVECVPAIVGKFEGELPGGSARLVESDGRVFFGAADEGQILVGELFEDGHDTQILATTTRRTRVRIDANESRIAAVWLDSQNQFILATRRFSERTWRFESIRASRYEASPEFDIALASGNLHVLFQDSRTLKRIWRDDISTPDGTWTLETVDDRSQDPTLRACTPPVGPLARGIGGAPSVVASSTSLLVAYLDRDCGDLRFARLGENVWTIDIVDKGGALGQDGRIGGHISLARSSAGEIGIAYHDEGLAALKYAVLTEGGFATEIVDPGLEIDGLARESKSVVGLFPSLAFSPGNQPSIAYLDGTRARLRLATVAGAQWALSTVAADGPVGWWAQTLYAGENQVIGSARFIRSERGTTPQWEAQWR